jgi:hypothetical protein
MSSPRPLLTGACLCGGVRFEISGKVGPVVYCHCVQCRKANGTAFGANAGVRARYLRFTAGRELIREYESSPGKLRAFCSCCGSPVYSRREDDPATFRIRLGLLDGDPERRSLAHCWVEEKAPWFEITDALPLFAREPRDEPSTTR